MVWWWAFNECVGSGFSVQPELIRVAVRNGFMSRFPVNNLGHIKIIDGKVLITNATPIGSLSLIGVASAT